MESLIQNLAALSFVDGRLDELREEYGDLPEKQKNAENKAKDTKALAEETEGILKEIRHFCSTSKVTLVELKSKEEKLAKQQFLVRNNREFDAITNEIETIRKEHEMLSDKLRTEGIKEENLGNILKEQQKNYEQAAKDLEEISSEMEIVTSDQNTEFSQLKDKRDEIAGKVKASTLKEYERVRNQYNDAAVSVKKNSCSGCFSAITPQVIVEMRNNMDKVYFCENCGRLLIPEEVSIDDSVLESI